MTTDDFIGVIDGSTSKTDSRISGKERNGRYCMLLISDFLRRLPRETTVDEFCDGVTEVIRGHYSRESMDHLSAHPEDRMTASVILYSRSRNEIWMIGDCQGIINRRLLENSKPEEKEIAGKRVSLILHSLSPEEARKAIIPDLIKAMREGQNKTYAVIDGFPVYRKGIIVIPCPCSPDTQLVLASDGYPFLRPTLEESEQLLARQLEQDPQNLRTFLATKGLKAGNKSFDDRAYIRFRP